jgi:hypothetical protein
MQRSNESQQHDPSSRIIKRGRRLAVIAAPLLLAVACSGTPKSPEATPLMLQKKADMQAPLAPTGGDYNNAEAAARAADAGDISTAVNLLTTLTDPAITIQAEHAVQAGYADRASLAASSGDLDTANSFLGSVTLPDLWGKTLTAFDTALADRAALAATSASGSDYDTARSLEAHITYPQIVAKVENTIGLEKSGDINGANASWNDLHRAALTEWSDLHSQALAEWDTLYLHSSNYLEQYNAAE